MKQYKKRIADKLLEQKLEGNGAVLIQGPKWCGKTTTAEQIAKSILYMDEPEHIRQNIELAQLSPKLLLTGDNPRLIDEWQLAPQLWDAIRFEADHRGNTGLFILTGSAVPADRSSIYHTGTGRFAWLTMRTMSLFESGDSTGELKLNDLFALKTPLYAENKLTITDLAFLICRGGWPASIDMRPEIALNKAFDYFDAVVQQDISRVDNVSRNVERVKRIMHSYARHQGAQASVNTICEDIKTHYASTINAETVTSYIDALKKIFVIEDVKAWNPNLRSKTAIRTSDTRYYSDPSIAVAALGLGPNDLIGDLNTMGLFFETLCMRDLRIYAESMGGDIYHYRDKSGLECDAVIHLRNGNYGLIEIKLGGDKLIEEGAITLQKLADKIDTDKMKAPAFKMILTGTSKYAMQRSDGIWVVPIGCLRD